MAEALEINRKLVTEERAEDSMILVLVNDVRRPAPLQLRQEVLCQKQLVALRVVAIQHEIVTTLDDRGEPVNPQRLDLLYHRRLGLGPLQKFLGMAHELFALLARDFIVRPPDLAFPPQPVELRSCLRPLRDETTGRRPLPPRGRRPAWRSRTGGVGGEWCMS